ncbi:MAG: hypothetical protein MJZ41_15755 [Bacteroidaceae bacterium]|nr:hypothetical protein [Bacteroidaceae bacterium]
MKFRISPYTSSIPFIIFLLMTITISFLGNINVNALAAIGIASILAGSFLTRDKNEYWDTIFGYLGNKTAMTATMLWLLVGVYGSILKEGHIVDGLVWASQQFNIGNVGFTLIAFLFSALFAISTGSGFGTISAMSMTLFPTGVALNASPILLGGAILSGASLGDSIAPVSDTAVIAATTQEYKDAQKGTADIGGTIKSRLFFVVTAFLLACVALVIAALFQSSESLEISSDITDSPYGLLLLIPTFVVIILSLRKCNIFISLFVGILLAIAIGLSFDLFKIDNLISFQNNSVDGAIINGIAGMTSICILLMVVVALSGIIIKSGCMKLLISRLNESMDDNRRTSELTIFFLTLIAGILIAAVNTIANICIAPFINIIGKQRNIHPYRRSTILATVICTFPFFVPYGGCVLLLIQGVKASGCDINLQATDVFFTTFYSWILLFIMFVACLTGYKSKSE